MPPSRDEADKNGKPNSDMEDSGKSAADTFPAFLDKPTLGRAEKLKSRKTISSLFTEGRSVYMPPFRVVWMPLTPGGSYPVQMAVSVARRNFNRAVDRNRIKRLIREAYRNHKGPFYRYLFNRRGACAVMIIYSGRRMPTYKGLASKIILILNRLKYEYEQFGTENTDDGQSR